MNLSASTKPNQAEVVYVVDDDEAVRDSLTWLLESNGYVVRCHASAERFLQSLQSTDKSTISCAILDVRMPGTSGLALFETLIARGLLQSLPVIFLTGHADVPTAVDAVKRGAFDFCEKPFSDNALVDRVEQALALSRHHQDLARQSAQQQQMLSDLTERELEVLHQVIQGLPNKLIADQLGISVRTVEVHRSRVFEKMGVKSAVELSNLVRGPKA